MKISNKLSEKKLTTYLIKSFTKSSFDPLIEFSLDFDDFDKITSGLFSEKVIYFPKEILEDKNFKKFRAWTDIALAYLKHHNKDLFLKIKLELNITNQKGIKILEDFEKFRIISILSKDFLGISANIRNIIEKPDFFSPESLVYYLYFRSDYKKELMNFKDSEELIILLTNSLDELYNQDNFLKIVAKIIKILNFQEESSNSQKTESKKESEIEKNDESKNQIPEISVTTAITDKEINEVVETEDKKNENYENHENHESKNKTKLEFIPEYKIFTKKFDQNIAPLKLATAQELKILRRSLDLKIKSLKKIPQKSILKLKRKLLSKNQVIIERNKEDGILDRKKLSQMIIKSSYDNYINIKNHSENDIAITILIDNSGSMRGSPIITSAIVSELIARIFERFNIRTEIIGFTTSNWRGGDSKKIWQQTGSVKNPGRLSDLRHIIYKSFNQPFSKLRLNLALMLKDGILKENIDGEALLFGRRRILAAKEKRKIMLIISDGMPIDDGTSSANDSDILFFHLNSVIKLIEREKRIELFSIGICHDLSEFYKNSIMIKTAEELGETVIEKLCNMI